MSPLEIRLGIEGISLEKVDFRRRSITVVLLMRLTWQDEYLTWNVTGSEITIISVDSKNIWIPDFGLGNFLRPAEFLKPEHIGRATVRNDEAFPGVLGNRGTRPFISGEQGNKAHFSGEQGNKL